MRRITAVLIAVALLGCSGRGKKKEQYKTEKVDRGSITETVTATGTLSAVTTVQVGSQVSGVISHLYADFNSRVKQGQLLAELDPTPFQAQVEQRQADLTKAQVDAANLKISFERQNRLMKAGLASQADYDSAKAQYDSAQAQVRQSTAALQQSLTNLRYTKILSPIDGIVVDRQYDVGQTVAASFQAPTLFQIAQDLTKMQCLADVDQSDIGRIQMGQVSRFTVDAYPDEEFRGRIAQIRLNATVTQNVVTYPVIIEVPNPDERLRPKMTANVTINVASVPDVLRIPNAALRFKPEPGTVPEAKPQAPRRSDMGGMSLIPSAYAAEIQPSTQTAPPAETQAATQTAQDTTGQQRGERRFGRPRPGSAEPGATGERRRAWGGQEGVPAEGRRAFAAAQQGAPGMGQTAAGTQGTAEGQSFRRRSTAAGAAGTTSGGPGFERSVGALGERQPGVTGAGAPWMMQKQQQKRGQTIYLLDPTTKTPKPVTIRTGITDGRYTQVVEGDVKVGDDVIVGLATSKVESLAPPGANRGPMGGGPGGGGTRRGGR